MKYIVVRSVFVPVVAKIYLKPEWQKFKSSRGELILILVTLCGLEYLLAMF